MMVLSSHLRKKFNSLLLKPQLLNLIKKQGKKNMVKVKRSNPKLLSHQRCNLNWLVKSNQKRKANLVLVESKDLYQVLSKLWKTVQETYLAHEIDQKLQKTNKQTPKLKTSKDLHQTSKR